MTDVAPAPTTAVWQHPKREQLIELTARTVRHAVAGTVPHADAVATVPASRYVDGERWQLEMDRVFRRVPLVAGFSCEYPDTGCFQAIELCGVPVIVVRGADGMLRAFVNACSHRGAQLVQGAGRSRRLTCPYHAWVYDTAGALVGIRDHGDFGDIDMGCNGLVALGCAERAGIVFVSLATLAGEPDIDIDTWLCGYGDFLDALGLATATFVGRQSVEGPNWKLAYDGYLDLYHLPILHKGSFGPDIANTAIYDAWGPHQRVSSPDAQMAALADRPSSEWPRSALTTGIWTIFPHVSIARFHAGVRLFMVSQLVPGPTPDRSRTVQHFLAGADPTDHMADIERQMAFLLRVVRDEDYATGIRIGQALATGARKHVMFGRNEAGGQRFHGWVDELVAAESNAEVSALLEAAEPIWQR